MLDIGLNLGVAELATDETLRVEDGVVGVHRDLVLGRITDQTLGVGEGNVRGRRTVTLVVGDDLNTIILPYTNAPVQRGVSSLFGRIDRRRCGYSRVGGTKINANRLGHCGGWEEGKRKLRKEVGKRVGDESTSPFVN